MLQDEKESLLREIIIKSVKNDPSLIESLDYKLTDKEKMTVLKLDISAFKHIKNNNNEMILYVLSKNGYLLKTIKKPTYEMCINALSNEGGLLQYVIDELHIPPTYDLCKIAINNDPSVIHMIYIRKYDRYLELLDLSLKISEGRSLLELPGWDPPPMEYIDKTFSYAEKLEWPYSNMSIVWSYIAEKSKLDIYSMQHLIVKMASYDINCLQNIVWNKLESKYRHELICDQPKIILKVLPLGHDDIESFISVLGNKVNDELKLIFSYERFAYIINYIFNIRNTKLTKQEFTRLFKNIEIQYQRKDDTELRRKLGTAVECIDSKIFNGDLNYTLWLSEIL